MKRLEWILFIFILAAAAGWKLILLSMNAFPFNADEAVVALMARHALQGNIPIFFYGQAYMGSLDALLVAAVFSIFGQKIIAIRMVQLTLYLITIITTVEIGRVGFKSTKIGLTAAALLSIPTVNLTLYSTISLGGYGETLAIGNLILLSGIDLRQNIESGNEKVNFGLKFAILGILGGLGVWADGLTLVYSIPVMLWVISGLGTKKPGYSAFFIGQKLLVLIAGILMGALPWWVFAVQNGLGQLTGELLGSAVNVDQASILQQLLNRTINFLLIGMTAYLGFRPPWSVTWLALPLIPFALVFWCRVTGGWIKKIFSQNLFRPISRLLAGVVMTLVIGFIGTPFGNDPSGRYFLPMTVPFVLMAAEMMNAVFAKVRWTVLVTAGIILFQLIGTMQCALVNPPGMTTQFDSGTIIDHQYDSELIAFLKENREYYGYANYWVTYPLAFESGEQLIYIPRLPYHQDFRYTSRDDRYAPYRTTVNQSTKTAYITTHHEALNQYLRDAFNRLGISWQEKKIGDYQVFYQLSRPIRPEEIGLGDASKP